MSSPVERLAHCPFTLPYFKTQSLSRTLPSAGVDVDVSVSQTADGEHHTVRVEGRASDGAGPCGREEGSVGLDGVDARAVDVEEGEGVGVGATVLTRTLD